MIVFDVNNPWELAKEQLRRKWTVMGGRTSLNRQVTDTACLEKEKRNVRKCIPGRKENPKGERNMALRSGPKIAQILAVKGRTKLGM